MDELITWLRQQLDNDERMARAAVADYDGEGSWCIEPPDPDESWARPRLFWLAVTNSVDPETMPPGMAEHIARWDPDRVLAAVEAKRRVLDEFEKALGRRKQYPADQANAGALLMMVRIVKLLAQSYAGQEGWREEWRAE